MVVVLSSLMLLLLFKCTGSLMELLFDLIILVSILIVLTVF